MAFLDGSNRSSRRATGRDAVVYEDHDSIAELGHRSALAKPFDSPSHRTYLATCDVHQHGSADVGLRSHRTRGSNAGTGLAANWPVSTIANASAHEIGELCVGADWACANGDLEALCNIARQLAAYADEPLHCKLAMLADVCCLDPDRAVSAWMRLKEQVLDEPREPSRASSLSCSARRRQVEQLRDGDQVVAALSSSVEQDDPSPAHPD